MIDEKFQQNTSIPYVIYTKVENPKLPFLFFISCDFIFPPNECLGLCRYRLGHSFGEKIK